MNNANQGSVSISGPVDFLTHYKATRAVVSRTKAIYIYYGFFVAIPVLTIICLLALGHNISASSVLGLPAWVVLLAGSLLMVVILPLTNALNVWQMRRRSSCIRGILTFTVTQDGFESHGATFEVKLRWDGILRAVETKEFFLLYISVRWAHFIPKSCASSPSQVQSIREIIREALGDRAKVQVV